MPNQAAPRDDTLLYATERRNITKRQDGALQHGEAGQDSTPLSGKTRQNGEARPNRTLPSGNT